MSWLLPKRTAEATAAQLAATGAVGGALDPYDGETGWTRLGHGAREVPEVTREKLRQFSIAAYRSNPMARAIIDTYTSFCVGDSGLTLQVASDLVRPIAERFWRDPRNDLAGVQELLLRDHLLQGETLLELMVGATTGVVRYGIIDPQRIRRIASWRGNPLHAETISIASTGREIELAVAAINDVTGLRTGEAMLWRSFRTLAIDTRGVPFMAPIVDWLDSYDTVLSNLVDRTALMRYFTWDVTIDGGQAEIDDFVAKRGNLQAPSSGSVEVHNNKVTWDAKSPTTGSYEDTNTAGSILTLIAGGAGLAKTWLADPEDANRATSLTMAEPVRRRVGGVQRMWLGYITELVRFAVDQAVAAGRIPALVDVPDPAGGTRQVPAAETVTVTGPEIAAADAQVTATVLVQLSQALTQLVAAGVMTPEAAKVAARKGWEDYVGVPYQPELDRADGTTLDGLTETIETFFASASRS